MKPILIIGKRRWLFHWTSLATPINDIERAIALNAAANDDHWAGRSA